MSNTLRERANALLRSQQPSQFPDASQYTPPRYGDMVAGRIYGDVSFNPHPVDARTGGTTFFKTMANPVTVYHDPLHPIHTIVPAIAKNQALQKENPLMTQLTYLRGLLMLFAADLKDNAKTIALMLCVCFISVWQVTTANASNTVLQDQNRARASVIAELTQANTLLAQQSAADKKLWAEQNAATERRIQALETQVASVASVHDALRELAAQTEQLKQATLATQRLARRAASATPAGPANLLDTPATSAGPPSLP